MDIDVDLKRLVEYYEQVNPLAISLDEAMKRMVRFCERLHAYIEHLSLDKKKEVGSKLGEITLAIQKMVGPWIERTGMSEDDLLMATHNPEGFNEELWKMVQDSKQQLIACMKKIVTALITVEPKSKKSEVVSKDSGKPHQPRRSQWMRS